MALNVSIKLRRSTAAKWAARNPVLDPGEPGYETDTYKFKIGDGQLEWIDLPYFTPNDDAALYAQLLAHVNAVLAESVYDDDGPSLFLLYQNAKV